MKTVEAETNLLLLSAHDRAGLLACLDRLLAKLSAGYPLDDDDCVSQPGDSERLAIIAPSGSLVNRLDMARLQLAKLPRNRLILRDHGIYFAVGDIPGRIAFLFPGEGSQRVGMLRQAYERMVPVRAWLDALDETYSRVGEPVPSRLIFPPDGQVGDKRTLFDICHSAQLGTVFNLALYEVIIGLGIRPDAMLGHSNGEHAAVIAACMDSTADRDRICDWLRRSSLAALRLGMPKIPERMIAVSALSRTTLDAVLSRFQGELFLAMDNCPLQQVLGGSRSAVRNAAAAIAETGGVCRELPFERAYHTPLFAKWAKMQAERYRDLPLMPPRIPIFSCLSGSKMPSDPDALRDTMTEQWIAPVRLRAAIDGLYEFGVRTFVEVGPDNKLSAFVNDTLRGHQHLAVAASSTQRGDLAQLQLLLASLHTRGVSIDTVRLRLLLAPPRSVLPPSLLSVTVAAQVELVAAARASMERMGQLFIAASKPSERMLQQRGALLQSLLRPQRNRLAAERLLCRRTDPFLTDHCLGRPPGRPLAVLSFTTSLAIAAEAARQVSGTDTAVVLTDLRASRWLALDGGSLMLRVEAERQGHVIKVELFDSSSEPAFTANVEFAVAPVATMIPEHRGGLPLRWTPNSFYRDYAFHGPSFQGIKLVTAISPHSITAELVVINLPCIGSGMLETDPGLLDCAGQLVAFWLLEQVGMPPTMGVFPYAARRVILHCPPPPGAKVRCHGIISFYDGIRTESSFIFTFGDRTVAIIEGLEQRVLSLPPAVASWVFGSRDGELSLPTKEGARSIDIDEWMEALGGNDGIWTRALAHLMLGEVELAHWLATRDATSLLESITAKEATRDWTRKHGQNPPQMEDIIVADGSVRCTDFQASLVVHRDRNFLTAIVGADYD